MAANISVSVLLHARAACDISARRTAGETIVRSRLCVLFLMCLGLARAEAGELVFDTLEIPREPADKALIRTTAGAAIDGRKVPLRFMPLMSGGARIGGGTFGLSLDVNGKPIRDADGKPFISTYPDFTSLMKIGGRLWGVTHFESLPSSLYLTRFSQDKRSGQLAAIDTRPLRLSHIHGIYNPCAGQLSPWGTHLGGEEYPPDVRAFEDAMERGELEKLGRWVPRMLRYFAIDPQNPDAGSIKTHFKPYRYGYPFEVTVKGWQNITVVRHHAMGRFSHELAFVMPDRRTVYMTDDGDNTGFFMFIADRAGDLAAGRLFAARWMQTSTAGGHEAKADLTWVDLGHASSREIAQAIEGGATFARLFETADMRDDGGCPAGFGATNFVGEKSRQAGECLKIRAGQEIIASRLETRRYAALKGATTEFNKAEGITYDPKRNRLYTAITSIDRGMGDATEKGKPGDRYERGGPNHIRLGYNPCGVVFALDLGRDETIGSDYVARSMAALVTGRSDPEGVAAGVNTCAVDGIANPDNLTFIPEHDTLIIAEDSDDGHENDAIWAYDVGRGKLTRILSVPQGAEATGVFWYPNIDGHGYLTAVVQHPFAETGKGSVKPPSNDPKYRAAVVGVIGPFPSKKRSEN